MKKGILSDVYMISDTNLGYDTSQIDSIYDKPIKLIPGNRLESTDYHVNPKDGTIEKRGNGSIRIRSIDQNRNYAIVYRTSMHRKDLPSYHLNIMKISPGFTIP